MMPRILITGPSGMGKTTLAKWISQEWEIPFVSVSILRDIAKCNDIKTHQDVIDLAKIDPDKHDLLQWELLSERFQAFSAHQRSGFVTDRGHIDSLAYVRTQSYRDENWNKFLNLAKRMDRLFTHVIFIPFIEGWELEDDGKRIPNSDYQNLMTFMYEQQLGKFNRDKTCLILKATDFEVRKSYVEDYINKY